MIWKNSIDGMIVLESCTTYNSSNFSFEIRTSDCSHQNRTWVLKLRWLDKIFSNSQQSQTIMNSLLMEQLKLSDSRPFNYSTLSNIRCLLNNLKVDYLKRNCPSTVQSPMQNCKICTKAKFHMSKFHLNIPLSSIYQYIICHHDKPR